MSAVPKPDKREAPVVVSLGDDLANFFQSSPPAPIDLAVIFSNFHRLGAKKAATAAVLAWETPDPIGLAALDKALGKFDSLVMAAPLSRGAASSAMPGAFRRASLPLTKIDGDTAALPAVNRIPLPGVILGGETAVAGFTTLESEPPSEFPPLIARWEDRLVFAFPLLTVLQRNNFPLDGVEIHLGEYIKLSPAGPVIPLDNYGRLAVSIKSIAALKQISAEALIDGGDGLFPKTAPEPVILRDDQSAAEPATRAFSKRLSAMVAAIASDQGFASSTSYPRITLNSEFVLLTLMVLLINLVCFMPEFRRHIGLGVMAGIFLTAQWLGVGMASVWLPLLPVLTTIAAAAVVCKLILECTPTAVLEIATPLIEAEPTIEITPVPAVIQPVIIEPTPVPEPPAKEKKPRAPRAKKASVETIPADKPARKTAEKKPPAKKAAAKKTAAKKTVAKKTSPRKKTEE